LLIASLSGLITGINDALATFSYVPALRLNDGMGVNQIMQPNGNRRSSRAAYGIDRAWIELAQPMIERLCSDPDDLGFHCRKTELSRRYVDAIR